MTKKSKYAACAMAILVLLIVWQFTSRASAQPSSNTAETVASARDQYQRMLDEQEVRAKRAEAMLNKQEVYAKRAEELLTKQEELFNRQAKGTERYEKILETWERQQKQYQKYLDSLGKNAKPNN